MASILSSVPKGLLKAHRKATRFFRPHSNSLAHLPTEMKQAILISLPDVPSLYATILTCSSLYHSFLDSESFILGMVLQNQITPSLMVNALATFQASKMIPWKRMATDDLIMLYTSRAKYSLPFTLRDAMTLAEMHGHVERFAEQFAISALSHSPVSGRPRSSSVSASPSEMLRIKRSLYRFEFCCNMFNPHKAGRRWSSQEDFQMSVVNKQGGYHFRGFAPWENEQLACIRDYLYGVIKDACKNTRNQRAVRGIWHRPALKVVDPRHYLPLGLLGVFYFAAFKPSKIRHLLEYVYQWEDNHLLANITPGANHLHLPTLRSLAKEEEDIWIPTQVACDGDAGPRDAWRWAHNDQHADCWFALKEHEDRRLWGYVMWDSARLEEWGALR